VQLPARKGLITVRAGKGGRYREIPVRAGPREHVALWISDERPGWPGSDTSPALLLNRRGGRLPARGVHGILLAIAAGARLDPGFSGHVLRHTFGTRLVCAAATTSPWSPSSWDMPGPRPPAATACPPPTMPGPSSTASPQTADQRFSLPLAGFRRTPVRTRR
jgi:integrase-like protein